MSERKLVSVVTGTWQRHELLLGAHSNLRRQTYPSLEHIIVSDGPDPELRAMIEDLGFFGESEPVRTIPVTFQECGRNWSTVLPDSFGAAPLLVGQLLARGDYQTYLADDERGTPDHIESLVDLLEERDADFAYSQTEMYWNGRPEKRWIIGTDPPQLGQITNVLYRSDLLKRGLYPLGAGMTSDWACIASWISAGATWAYLPRVTFEHRVDH